MPNLRGSEWLIIILLLVLLFGAKRLPDAARSMGRSLRIFKAETKGLSEETPGPVPAPTTDAGMKLRPFSGSRTAGRTGAPRPPRR